MEGRLAPVPAVGAGQHVPDFEIAGMVVRLARYHGDDDAHASSPSTDSNCADRFVGHRITVVAGLKPAATVPIDGCPSECWQGVARRW
jgi:hypothetical protein